MIIIFWRYIKLYAVGFALLGVWAALDGERLGWVMVGLGCLLFYLARDGEPNLTKLVKMAFGRFP